MAAVDGELCRWGQRLQEHWGQRLQKHWGSGVVKRVDVLFPWVEMGSVSVGESFSPMGCQFVWGA